MDPDPVFAQFDAVPRAIPIQSVPHLECACRHSNKKAAVPRIRHIGGGRPGLRQLDASRAGRALDGVTQQFLWHSDGLLAVRAVELEITHRVLLVIGHSWVPPARPENSYRLRERNRKFHRFGVVSGTDYPGLRGFPPPAGPALQPSRRNHRSR
jgi:hypothetical protein